MGNTGKGAVVRGDSKLAVKVGFWYTLSTFLTRGIAFITTPIFSRIMSKGDYGEFSNYASWQATLLILVSAELYNTLSRAYFDYKDNYDQYISSITIGSCFLSFFFYAIFMLSGRWIYRFVNIPPQYVNIMFFTMLCMSCRSIFLTREKTLYRYKAVVLISILGTLVPTIISVILVWLANPSAQLSTRIYGFYIPSSMVGFTCAVILILKGRMFRFEHFKYALRIAVPLLVNYLTIYLLTSTSVIIAKSIMGTEQAAVVSISTSVIHILTTLFQALSGALTIWIMDNLELNNNEKLRREIFIYILGVAILALGVILVAPEVVLILGGKTYLEAVGLIPFFVLSVMIQSMMTVFTIILTYDKNIKATAIAAAIVAVVSILAKIWLLPIFSLQSLSVTNAVAFAVLFAVNYILVKRAGYSSVINIKGFILVIAFVSLICVSTFFLYSNFVARYLVIALFGIGFVVFALKNKQLILSILKRKKK